MRENDAFFFFGFCFLPLVFAACVSCLIVFLHSLHINILIILSLFSTDHFKVDHYPCEHPHCLEQRFVVFPTEQELKTHTAREHGQTLTKAERKQALTLPVTLNVSIE